LKHLGIFQRELGVSGERVEDQRNVFQSER